MNLVRELIVKDYGVAVSDNNIDERLLNLCTQQRLFSQNIKRPDEKQCS